MRPHRRNTCLSPRLHAAGGCEHEERLVGAYIKGPTDKHLITTDKVHIWDTHRRCHEHDAVCSPNSQRMKCLQ